MMGRWVVKCEIASPIEFIGPRFVLSVSLDNDEKPVIILIIDKRYHRGYWINITNKPPFAPETWVGIRKSGGGESTINYLPAERRNMTIDEQREMLRRMNKIISGNRREICPKVLQILREAAEVIEGANVAK